MEFKKLSESEEQEQVLGHEKEATSGTVVWAFEGRVKGNQCIEGSPHGKKPGLPQTTMELAIKRHYADYYPIKSGVYHFLVRRRAPPKCRCRTWRPGLRPWLVLIPCRKKKESFSGYVLILCVYLLSPTVLFRSVGRFGKVHFLNSHSKT